MILNSLSIKGAFEIDIEQKSDDRGFFARLVDQKEFEKFGLNSNFVQQSISFNLKKGTLRGMHFQKSPFEEEKLIRVTKGAAYYVILDLRPNSATFKKSQGIELSVNNHKSLFLPKNVASGFITLEDNTEIQYQMTQEFVPEAADGVRWNDPAFNIAWPMTPNIISEKDKNLPDFKE